jgi:hypothetical protein
MIFVCYSRADEKWRKRFETISKPLSRSEKIEFWSDRKLNAGQWERQIDQAMKTALAAVLLVSDNFLASDYIMTKELPYFLRAHTERGLMIFWAYLEPCDLTRHREILKFQGMTLDELEPMSKMNDWKWKQTMVRGCEMIDEFLKGMERPVINPGLESKRFARMTANFPLLEKPAARDVEVLVYSPDKKWWRQAPVRKGTITTKIYLGSDRTKPGTEFPVVAMTCEKPLTGQTYLNLPVYRTKSEITLERA